MSESWEFAIDPTWDDETKLMVQQQNERIRFQLLLADIEDREKAAAAMRERRKVSRTKGYHPSRAA